MLQLLPPPKSQLCFTLIWPAVFQIQAIIWDKCNEYPPNDLKHWKFNLGTPYTYHNYPRVPNFTQFHSTSSRDKCTELPQNDFEH